MLREIWVVQNKLKVNIEFLHLYRHHYDKFALEYLLLLEIKTLVFNMISNAELHVNVRNNATIPPVIFYDTTICLIFGIKITCLVNKIIRWKTRHKSLIYFFYDIFTLQSNVFDILYFVGALKHDKNSPLPIPDLYGEVRVWFLWVNLLELSL